MDEGAVVGEQQQAGGVHVQPPDALHVALDERVGQQRIHAPVVLGLVGAFVAGGLVEGEVGLLAVGPGFALDLEDEAGGGDIDAGVVDDFALDADFAELDELAALAPAAEALGLEDAFEFHVKERVY